MGEKKKSYEIELRYSEYMNYEINQGFFMGKIEGITPTMEFCNTGV